MAKILPRGSGFKVEVVGFWVKGFGVWAKVLGLWLY